MHEPWVGSALGLAVIGLASVGCGPSGTTGVEATGSTPGTSTGTPTARATTTSVTELFGRITDKFYTGNTLGLGDLVVWSETALAFDRGTAIPMPDGDAHYELELPPGEALTGELIVRSTKDGVREFQLDFRGPATCGAFLPHVEYRRFRLSFGMTEAGEPRWAMANVRDVVERSDAARRAYQGLAATSVGGVMKVGTTQEETYWHQTSLAAEVLPEVPGSAESKQIKWTYKYGVRAPGVMKDLSVVTDLFASIP